MKLFTRAIVSLIVFLSLSSQTQAHGVQVAYCANCKDLTIYLEHWHGAAIDTGTVTFQILTATNTYNYTIAPVANIQNTTKNNLPCPGGTATTIGSCPTSANTYNDWMVYKMPGLGCGQLISISVISGNSIIVTDCGGMYPISTPAFNVPCDTSVAPIQVADQAVCEGDPFNGVNFPPFPGYTYNWTNTDPLIGLAASGFGSIFAFVSNSTTQNRTGVVNVTRGCADTTFNLTVWNNPTAIYSYTQACDGDSTFFQDLSQPNIAKRYWDFENNSSIEDSSVSTGYLFPAGGGPFSVRHEVIDSNGCSESVVTTVIVDPLPTAAFSMDSMACQNSPLSLTDASTISSGSIAGWMWDILNDNTVDYSTQNPTHSFSNTGMQQIELLVISNAGCKDSILDSIPVAVSPVAAFTLDSSVCTGATFSMTDASTVSTGTITNWDWDVLDDNSIDYTTQNASHSFASAGTYHIELRVTASSGCQDSIVDSIPAIVCAGIQELEISELSLYPNPAQSAFYIDIQDPQIDGMNILLYGIQGNLLRSEKVLSQFQAMSVADLANGTYMVVISREGIPLQRSRLVVQR